MASPVIGIAPLRGLTFEKPVGTCWGAGPGKGKPTHASALARLWQQRNGHRTRSQYALLPPKSWYIRPKLSFYK